MYTAPEKTGAVAGSLLSRDRIIGNPMRMEIHVKIKNAKKVVKTGDKFE